MGRFYIAVLGICAYFLFAGAVERRGMCLSLCGRYGVACPPGYECRGNGCGHECYQANGYRQPEGCLASSCDLHCPLGYRKDENGCDECKCDYSLLLLRNHTA
ncbi:hypothetical protein ScPMuIL_002916 [Solemya velum]